MMLLIKSESEKCLPLKDESELILLTLEAAFFEPAGLVVGLVGGLD